MQRVVEELQVDLIAGVGEEFGDAFGPFNQQDAVAFKIFFEAHCHELMRIFDTIEVGVIERHTADIFEHIVEGRRENFFAHAESAADTAGYDGFARTEFTGETDDVARAEPLCEFLRPDESFFR